MNIPTDFFLSSMIRFLFDTGSVISLLPVTSLVKILPCDLKLLLKMVQKLPPIATNFYQYILVSISSIYEFYCNWSTLRNSRHWFSHKKSNFFDRASPTVTDKQSQPLCHATLENASIINIIASDQVKRLFEKFPLVTDDLSSQPSKKILIKHRIVTTWSPVFQKSKRLHQDSLKQAQTLFNDYVRQGICRLSSSFWSSPLHVAPKKDSTVRQCSDYRRLNAQTIPNKDIQ